MTFKKIHRRADLPEFQKRQLLIGQSTTTAAAATSTHTSSQGGPNVVAPTGPPLVLTSSTAASHSTTSTSSSSIPPTSAPTSTSATVPTTPPAGTTVPTAQVSNVVPGASTTRTVTQRVTYSSTSQAATATTTSGDPPGMGLGSIAGIAVAAIVAIGVTSAFVVWLIKRRNKNRDIDEEPFNRHSWMRNSTAIPDDEDAPLPSRVRPPPAPSMMERQPTPLYGQQAPNFGADPSGFNYATQPSYNSAPGQLYSPNAFGPGGAPATPLPHSPGFGNTYDQQGFNNNGGYQELTRGPGMHDYPPSPARGFEPHFDNPHSPSYIGHESFPVPPPNAAGAVQFDQHGQEIQHRSMTPAQHGQVVSVRNSVHDGRETPVQLGFAPGPGPAGHAPNAAAPAHGRQPGARPETVYDTDDAYGGI